MERPKKLTREQKSFLDRKGIDSVEFNLIHESNVDIQIINKFTHELKTIKK